VKPECKKCPLAAKCATHTGPHGMFWDMVGAEMHTAEVARKLRGKLPAHCSLNEHIRMNVIPYGVTWP